MHTHDQSFITHLKFIQHDYYMLYSLTLFVVCDHHETDILYTARAAKR